MQGIPFMKTRQISNRDQGFYEGWCFKNEL